MNRRVGGCVGIDLDEQTAAEPFVGARRAKNAAIREGSPLQNLGPDNFGAQRRGPETVGGEKNEKDVSWGAVHD